MKTEAKLVLLEAKLEQHLEEASGIRNDIASLKQFANDAKDLPADMRWLKRAFWSLVTLGIGFNVALVTYVLNHRS